jgi:hypothetical protein
MERMCANPAGDSQVCGVVNVIRLEEVIGRNNRPKDDQPKIFPMTCGSGSSVGGSRRRRRAQGAGSATTADALEQPLSWTEIRKRIKAEMSPACRFLSCFASINCVTVSTTITGFY